MVLVGVTSGAWAELLSSGSMSLRPDQSLHRGREGETGCSSGGKQHAGSVTCTRLVEMFYKVQEYR